MKYYLIFLILLMFIPQTLMNIHYEDCTGDIYALGFVIGMVALRLFRWFK